MPSKPGNFVEPAITDTAPEGRTRDISGNKQL